mmetsp:Transcript_36863/g.97487  ORF Transcript_36863/g.97487 Transcript_36863/m.97487 type:complete len:230 (-) Transcript_36863:284-973(-)
MAGNASGGPPSRLRDGNGLLRGVRAVRAGAQAGCGGRDTLPTWQDEGLLPCLPPREPREAPRCRPRRERHRAPEAISWPAMPAALSAAAARCHSDCGLLATPSGAGAVRAAAHSNHPPRGRLAWPSFSQALSRPPRSGAHPDGASCGARKVACTRVAPQCAGNAHPGGGASSRADEGLPPAAACRTLVAEQAAHGQPAATVQARACREEGGGQAVHAASQDASPAAGGD